MIYDFHPEARLEYREAAVFNKARLGAAFTLEIEAAIHRILETPERLAGICITLNWQSRKTLNTIRRPAA